MTSFEIYNLMSYKQRKEEDLRVVERGCLEDLDEYLIKAYLKKVRETRPNFAKFNDETALEKLGIIKKIGRLYKPTIAGLMCFGISPDLLLPQLVITAVVIPGFKIGDTGELGERFIDNKKVIGTIPQMIRGAVEFVTKNMKKRTIVRQDTGQRDDKLEYPVDAIREAITNSLVHRDYSVHTESNYISIRMFSDRLEITNPGGLYGDLTVENLSNITNPPIRNKNMIRILEEMGEIENRSSGIATMINSMRELKLEPPVFENKRGEFTVIFKNHNLMTKGDKEWLRNIDVSLSENEAYAMVFIKNNGKITNGDYQKINNVNRDKALSELRGLMTKGLIKPQGVGSGTYYVLNDSVSNSAQISFIDLKELKDTDEKFKADTDITPKNTDITPINTEKNRFNTDVLQMGTNISKLNLSKNEELVIEYLLENEKITNHEVRAITKLKKDGAKNLLQNMVLKELIIPLGKNKGRYYVLAASTQGLVK